MSGLFGGGKQTIATESPRIGALRIQSSSFGMPIPIVFGKTRLSCNLIWYGDFTAIPHTTTTSGGGGGGKGGGGVTQTNTEYTYQTALAIGLCEGPIAALGTVWAGKTQRTLAELGLSQFLGAYPQSPWSYLTTNHPGQDLGYQGLAYVANGAYDLGASANLPNHSFEVQGFSAFNPGGGIYDANPKDIVTAFLTNANWGAGFPSAKLGDLTSFSNYCVANGLFMSPAYVEQKEAQEHLAELLDMANAAPVWSEGLLKVVPYGDQAATGNGATYTPDTTPQYDLTDDDFLHEDDEDPITVLRGTPADAFNQVTVEYQNRANQYNPEPAVADDLANIERFGLRPDQPKKMHAILDVAVARAVAQLKLQRTLYVRNQYRFRLGWKYARLEPMDIVTITDSALGLSLFQVRVLEVEEADVEEGDGGFDILAEEFPAGNATSAVYASQTGSGYNVNFNVSAGNVNPPVIFDAPGEMTVTGYELWAAVSAADANYGGCEVWASTDNATFKRIGTIYGSARHGTLTANFASSADPDTVNSCAVDLTASKGSLIGGTQTDADLRNLLCYVDGELISYQAATLTAQYKYTLGTYIRRGVYNSPIKAHASGSTFVRLDTAILRYAYDPTLVGRPLYLKFLSFNKWGGGKQGLADVSAYSYTIGGSISRPDNVTGYTVAQNGNVAVFQWTVVDLATNTNVLGYDIRYDKRGTPGDSATRFASATPVTRATRGSQITTAKVPPGDWTFFIAAYDISDQYSRTPATFDLEIVNVNDVVQSAEQAPDWRGMCQGFIRHPSGVLIPDSSKAANQHTRAELFEQFVPYPVAEAVYEAPEFDLGFDADAVRVWADIASALGRGVTAGTADPGLQVDYRLAAAAYDGFEPWTIGTANFRRLKARLALDPAQGVAVVSAFKPVCDVEERTINEKDLTIPVGGLARTFSPQFHQKPYVSPVCNTAGRYVTVESVSATGCTLKGWDSTGSDVGATGGYEATGV